MSLQKPPSGLKEKPLSHEAHNFDYAALDSKTRIVVQQRTSEIKERLRDTAQAFRDIDGILRRQVTNPVPTC